MTDDIDNNIDEDHTDWTYIDNSNDITDYIDTEDLNGLADIDDLTQLKELNDSNNNDLNNARDISEQNIVNDDMIVSNLEGVYDGNDTCCGLSDLNNLIDLTDLTFLYNSIGIDFSRICNYARCAKIIWVFNHVKSF